MKLYQFFRLFYINWTLLRHGLDEIILATHLFRPIRFLAYILPGRWRKTVSSAPRGVRIRRALEDLGPIFVKLGQILSTRYDLLPSDITDELSLLQDRVAPFPYDQAKKIIETAYGQPISKVFASFDSQHLASASIAQVYGAVLQGDIKVVVKVVRPGIKRIIQSDIELLHILAGLAEKYWSEGPRLHPRGVVAELEKVLYDELDMIREGASASQLKRNFTGSTNLYVPTIYWDYTRSNVLVIERVYGIPIGDIKKLQRYEINFQRLAETGVEIFFTQVFQHSFFHADMHPGNILVSTENPENPSYIAIDFGIMGTLGTEDQHYLAENFLAFFNHDYRRVAELHVDAGWVASNTRVDEFESAIRSVCEPIFDRPLKDISFGQFLVRLFQTARRFHMEVQPQLVLLQKTLLSIESLGRSLYPDLDLWKTGKPILERWMNQQTGPYAAYSALKTNMPRWANTLPEIPLLTYEVIKQASKGHLRIRLAPEDLSALNQEIRRASLRVTTAVVGAALLLGSAVIYSVNNALPIVWEKIPLLSWLFAGIGLVFITIAWRSKRNIKQNID
ncbi:ubiquinone biosynthesis regulatory protein kinase UbiB [Candidatus Nitrosacidococcus tergens]|uniref:2-octaprenylphenol hydroxylase n=1 Tax=Candidatus Nitrosacidococcus tergens TaxID=553981 RepID=A0A7G1Q8I5_9GAMM|nr:ubiquinone biosynthesis regulatory protein kinase UbiB [Candidatus Nitrosacidococcus tergens]CAB1274764.1 2-octaprenylphenol hydroxylase [Candidatus Nitrosacidococcus tergens]